MAAISDTNPEISREVRRLGQQFGLTATLKRLTTRREVPAAVVRGALLPYEVAGYLSKHSLDYHRLVRTLSLPIDPLSDAGGPLPEIEVTIPCGPSDVEIVAYAVDGVHHGSSNPIRSIRVVTPHSLIPSIRRALGARAEVVDERDLMPSNVTTQLTERFPKRRNWVLQQLIKVAAVLHSDSQGVLILDADTTLVHTRTWLTADGTQVLTPTLEWHTPYYAYLSGLTGGRLPNPQFSFVPHHMVMQPVKLRVIMASMGLGSLDDLVERLGDESSYATESMFCVDYELYAQGLVALEPEHVRLAKWSNLSVGRQHALVTEQYAPYMSISRHHYLG